MGTPRSGSHIQRAAELSEIPTGSQDEFIRSLLASSEVPKLSPEGIALLRARLETLGRLSQSHDDPIEQKNRQKLQEILLYNEQLREIADSGGQVSHKGQSIKEGHRPLLQVERWSYLAIGIDSDWEYWVKLHAGIQPTV